MGAVGRREAWPRRLPTPTPTSSYIATPVAFLGPAPRLTHDQEQPRLIFQRGAEAGALSTKAVTALEAAPARPIGRFVFSLCVDGGAAEKQLDFPLHRPPPLVLRSPR